MIISDVDVLLDLYKSKNVESTARVFNYSNSNIYHIINKLEKEFGLEIIEKNKKSINFTKNGILAIKKLQIIKDNYNSIIELGNHKTLKVAIDSFYYPSIITPLIKNKTSNIQLITKYKYYNHFTELQNRNIDIYFDYPTKENRDIFHYLYTDKIYLTSLSSNFNNVSYISLDNLAGSKFYLTTADFERSTSIIDSLIEHNIDINVIDNDEESLLNLLLQQENTYTFVTETYKNDIPKNSVCIEIKDLKLDFGYCCLDNSPEIISFVKPLMQKNK